MVIGLKFLLMFGKVAIAVALAAFIVFVFFAVVTYALRFLFSGFKWTIQDHWEWIKSMRPRRRKIYEVYRRGMRVGTTIDPEVFQQDSDYQLFEMKEKSHE
jgi:hypothetical protein